MNQVIQATPTDVAFTDVRQAITEIAEANRSLVIDYDTPSGIKEAKAQVAKLKKINGAIDRKHKEIKADVLEQSRLIDGAKKELKSSVAEMIAVHQDPIDEINRAEADRQAKLEEGIREIKRIRETVGPTTSMEECRKSIEQLLEIEVSAETFQERYEEATETMDSVLGELMTLADLAKEREAKDRELAELREKDRQRDAADREAKIASEAAAAEREKAEKEKAELIAAGEKAAADAELEKAQAIEDERARVDQLHADDKAAEAKRKADLDHVENIRGEVYFDLVENAGLPTNLTGAQVVLDAIADGKIRHVSIKF